MKRKQGQHIFLIPFACGLSFLVFSPCFWLSIYIYIYICIYIVNLDLGYCTFSVGTEDLFSKHCNKKTKLLSDNKSPKCLVFCMSYLDIFGCIWFNNFFDLFCICAAATSNRFDHWQVPGKSRFWPASAGFKFTI